MSNIVEITKGAEEPSKIGNSGPSTSTNALSIPKPMKAAMRCSTVDIEIPLLFDSFVHKLVSETLR